MNPKRFEKQKSMQVSWLCIFTGSYYSEKSQANRTNYNYYRTEYLFFSSIDFNFWESSLRPG